MDSRVCELQNVDMLASTFISFSQVQLVAHLVRYIRLLILSGCPFRHVNESNPIIVSAKLK